MNDALRQLSGKLKKRAELTYNTQRLVPERIIIEAKIMNEIALMIDDCLDNKEVEHKHLYKDVCVYCEKK
jgi:hypothetical protein